MNQEKTRILIVDDEPQNTAIIQEILYFQDQYEFSAVGSGAEALEIVNSFRPEIVLLDIMMPGMDGYEVCKCIRAEQAHRFIKIIMVSGLAMVDERLQGYEAGADDYITKPFDEDELLAKIAVYSKLSRIEEVELLKTTALHLMTHETRTPLNGILLGSELLKEVEEIPQEAKQYVDIIYSSGERMRRLFAKVNLLCQLKGGIDLILVEQSLEKCLKAVIAEMGSEFPDVEIVCSCEKDIEMSADWELLSKGFYNVIENGCKFTGSSKTLCVTIRQVDDATLVIVEDDGPGVNQETMDRIFEGFFTEDIMHHHKGAGLSLSITRLIMHHHRGKIRCENRVEGGTRFTFSFPRLHQTK